MICKRALEQKEWRMMNDYDVLIAGSGVAGLYAALNFAPEVRVLVLSKRSGCSATAPWPRGVAAVVDKENDDFRLHIADTLIAGGYKNNLRSLEILVNEGPEDVLRLLKEMHVDFDRDSEHHISMTLEGGGIPAAASCITRTRPAGRSPRSSWPRPWKNPISPFSITPSS